MPFTSDFQCYSGNSLDRAQIERRDPAVLDRLLSSPGSRVVPFQAEKPLIALNDTGPGGEIGWLPLNDRRIKPVERQSFYLLGTTTDGQARFVCDIHSAGDDFDREAALYSDVGKFIDLRSVGMQGLIANPDLGILAQAKSMTSWHHSHRFCSACGVASVSEDGGIRRHCPSCQTDHFPRTDPVVIMLIINGNDCLLGRGANYNQGQYSTLAGFVDQGETIEEAVRREIREETRVDVGAVSYCTSQPWPFPSTLMIGCFGQALTCDIHIDDHEIEHARWFSRDEVGLMFDKTHPDGLIVPPGYAIAHHLIRHFAEGGLTALSPGPTTR